MSIQSIETRVKKLEDTTASIETKLDEVRLTLATAKGGWRMLVIVGGAMATIVAVIVGAIETLRGAH